MNPGFDTYIRKLRHYKDLYIIDEEAYGDLSKSEAKEMKKILNDFVKYVELAANPFRGNWCNPVVDEEKK